MTLESERILERYRTTEKEADELGRLIGVRRLRPSEQTKIAGMTPELTGSEEADERDPELNTLTGNKLHVSHRLPLLIAAAVCEIDGVKIPFPRNRLELDAIYDRLDTEGLGAASKAFTRLIQNARSGDPRDDAKN